jgi:hypothetical protein
MLTDYFATMYAARKIDTYVAFVINMAAELGRAGRRPSAIKT